MDIVVDVPDKPEVARPELEVILAVGYDEVGACGLGIQLFSVEASRTCISGNRNCAFT